MIKVKRKNNSSTTVGVSKCINLMSSTLRVIKVTQNKTLLRPYSDDKNKHTTVPLTSNKLYKENKNLP